MEKSFRTRIFQRQRVSRFVGRLCELELIAPLGYLGNDLEVIALTRPMVCVTDVSQKVDNAKLAVSQTGNKMRVDGVHNTHPAHALLGKFLPT
jgi:hypothetical protein